MEIRTKLCQRIGPDYLGLIGWSVSQQHVSDTRMGTTYCGSLGR
jgi:hypothetical protein